MDPRSAGALSRAVGVVGDVGRVAALLESVV
jgi:hypothetical protein